MLYTILEGDWLLKIFKLLKPKHWLLVILGVTVVLYLPSFWSFYTNDDFFLLKIAKPEGFSSYVNFFNLFAGPDGLGMYRPLTTQVFYSLAWFGNLHPTWLHLVSFVFFAGLLVLIYRLTLKLKLTKTSALAAVFLYSTSATHFAHFYYLATFQEIGMTFFVLLSLLLFVYFRQTKNSLYFLGSLAAFLLSLASKETAIVTPALLFLVAIYVEFSDTKKFSVKQIYPLLTANLILLIPHFLFLLIYFYLRVFHYGFAEGDSYVWDFSAKMVNTLFWYGLWSFNLPEMLVDFVGPGIKFNPNLFKYWSDQVIPIFLLFGFLCLQTVTCFIKSMKQVNWRLAVFSMFWFVFSLVPVVFLPIHKFTFYLTLPLVGLTVLIASLIDFQKPLVKTLFVSTWVVLSFLTLLLTHQTHWVTQGQRVSLRLYTYFQEKNYERPTKVLFVDTEKDSDLPWSPTQVVKVALSDNNFFQVFYGDRIRAYYTEVDSVDTGLIKIESRPFLGY